MIGLKENLLTYIGYCLSGRRFSYEKCSDDFKKLGINHELTTLRKEFSLAKKEKLLDFKTHYRKPEPVLTASGKLEIKTRLAFKKYGDWDQKWRMVLLDMPERERPWRMDLVEKLEKIGFANLSRGSYISPYPLLATVGRIAADLGIRQHIFLMTVEKIVDDDNIKKKWRLFEINELYKDFLQKAGRQMVLHKADRTWPIYAKRLEDEFAQIFATDPHLPEEFLPKDWRGPKAYATFKEISNSY